MSQRQAKQRSLTVTGVDGFVGRHLARAAKEAGYVVRGVSRASDTDAVLAESLDEYFSCDLTKSFPSEALSDTVIHLAGLAAVGPSFSQPQLYIEANSSMVTHLCEAMLAADRPGKVIAVSTGAVYASSAEGEPMSEAHPTACSSPYVVSKLLVENQLRYYETRGLSTVIARPFNHIGPGQGPGFILPDLWARLSSLQSGEPLRVGNIDTTRDYLDVRDVVQAYLALAATADSGSYNICSGADHSGREILTLMCEEAGLPVPEIEIDASMLRPTDIQKVVGSSVKLRLDTGWAPQFTLRESIRDFLGAAAK